MTVGDFYAFPGICRRRFPCLVLVKSGRDSSFSGVNTKLLFPTPDGFSVASRAKIFGVVHADRTPLCIMPCEGRFFPIGPWREWVDAVSKDPGLLEELS